MSSALPLLRACLMAFSGGEGVFLRGSMPGSMLALGQKMMPRR